ESLYFLTLRRRDGDRVLTLLRRIDPAFAPTTALVPVAREEAGRGVPVTQLFQAGRGQGTLMLWLVFFMNLMVFYFLQNWLPIIFTDAGLSMESAVLTSTLISVGGIVAGLISGPLMDRFNAYNVLAAL